MRGRSIGATGFAIALAMSAAIATMPSGSPVEAAGRYVVRSNTRVAPGLRLLRITDRSGPNRIRVLKLNLQSRLTLEIELATDQIPGHETTSSMAARNGAIAAINGDYTLLPTDPQAGRPVHTFAQNAELITSPLVYGRNFSISRDEGSVYIGHPRFAAWLTQLDTFETWDVEAWNEVPAQVGEFSVYTMAGGFNHQPPRNACSSRLFPLSAPTMREDGSAVEQGFTVSESRCASKRLARKGGTVISAPWGSAEGKQIATELVPGETITLGWTTNWNNVEETIGGNPTLLENGLNTVGSCTDSYFCDRNPRTGIGIDTFGKILMVTVDGRQTKSVGMTPDEFSDLFRYLGATSALNLDGGGSTTMWTRGQIVNRISGTSERPVGSAILVVPQTFPQPTPTPTITPTPTPTPTESVTPAPDLNIYGDGAAALDEASAGSQVSCAALRDPASTGGFLDYLAKDRAFGRRLPLELREALAVYRGQRSCAALDGSPTTRR